MARLRPGRGTERSEGEDACTSSADLSIVSGAGHPRGRVGADQRESNHEKVLRACEAAVHRLATDRHYFARPSKTLFNDIRIYFPMCAQYRVYERHRRLPAPRADECFAEQADARLRRERQPAQCRATTRRARRASACRCRTTATARRISIWPRPKSGQALELPQRRLPPAMTARHLRVGFIGLGIMGSRMAANLRRAGFELTVVNRRASKAEAWADEHGARRSPPRPREAAGGERHRHHDGRGRRRRSRRCCSARTASSHGAPEGRCASTCRRSRPRDTRRIGGRSPSAASRFVDAPVTGSAPKAEDGTLTIMAGGADEDFARARPLFEAMGEIIVHVGELGQGQMVKLINNAVAAVNARRWPRRSSSAAAPASTSTRCVEVMRHGSAGSTMLALKAEPMRDPRLLDALQARAHAQGRAAVPRGGAGGGRAVPRRGGTRASSTRPPWAGATPTTTSPRCSRCSRARPACACEGAHDRRHGRRRVLHRRGLRAGRLHPLSSPAPSGRGSASCPRPAATATPTSSASTRPSGPSARSRRTCPLRAPPRGHPGPAAGAGRRLRGRRQHREHARGVADPRRRSSPCARPGRPAWCCAA